MSFCLETYLQQSDDYKVLAKNSGVKECYNTKPCHGTAAIELPVDKEELISIRKMDIGA